MKTFLKIGLIVFIIGIVGVGYFFYSFGVTVMDLVGNFTGDMPSMSSLLPNMFAFLGSGVVAAIGRVFLKLGLSILIGGKTAEFISETLKEKEELK